jgi:hypothetical protein
LTCFLWWRRFFLPNIFDFTNTISGIKSILCKVSCYNLVTINLSTLLNKCIFVKSGPFFGITTSIDGIQSCSSIGLFSWSLCIFFTSVCISWIHLSFNHFFFWRSSLTTSVNPVFDVLPLCHRCMRIKLDKIKQWYSPAYFFSSTFFYTIDVWTEVRVYFNRSLSLTNFLIITFLFSIYYAC